MPNTNNWTGLNTMLRRVIVHITVQFAIIIIAMIMLMLLPIMLLRGMLCNRNQEIGRTQRIQRYLEVHDIMRDSLKNYLELTMP
jgi:hypothetical protein